MAKLECKCGYLLSNTQVPNEIELRVYTDKEWDEIFESDSIKSWEIPLPKREVWKCPKCERIYVFEAESNKVERVYIPEEK